MSQTSEKLASQARSTPLVEHFHWGRGQAHRTTCIYSSKIPPEAVITQLLTEGKGDHEVALTRCICGTVFRYYPHGGIGLTGAWRTTSIQPRDS